MTDESCEIQQIFRIARSIADADVRGDYLDQVCSDRIALQERVVAMLAAAEDCGSFLENPAVPIVALETRDTVSNFRVGGNVGPYKLLQKLGEGGMGVVYLAEQSEPLRRQVALKLIKPGLDSRHVIARFEAERQALALMNHPNIAKVFGAGTTDFEQPYFVMELVKGVPITRYCDENRLDTRQRLALLRDVCAAVQHAHQKGIIHRDVKPSNVLVAEFDERAVPKVIDFGVAKATQQPLTDMTMFTEIGSIIGTIEYMSPEQARMNQLDIDTRSDVYSLGVLLYELLSGETPFSRDRSGEVALDEMLRMIREEEPSRPSIKIASSASLPSVAANRSVEPSRLRALVTGELDWIVMKSLEKERKRRYQSASALGDDIGCYLDDAPVSACPPSFTYRVRKSVKRNKAVVAAVSAITFTLLLGLFGTTWQALRAERLRRSAVRAEEIAEARLYQSLIAQADAHRFSHRIGQQFGTAEAIEAAVQLSSRSDRPNEHHQLQTAAIAANSLPDVRKLDRWPIPKLGKLSMLDFTDDLSHYCFVNAAGLSIRRSHDHREVASLPIAKTCERARFSSDGRWISVTDWDGQRGRVEVWDWRAERPAYRVKKPATLFACDFDHTNRFLAVGHPDGSVSLHDLKENRQVREFSVASDPIVLDYSPDDRFLAVSCESAFQVEVYRTSDMSLVRSLEHDTEVFSVAWAPSGDQLAVAQGFDIHLWKPTSEKQEPYRTLRAHTWVVSEMNFHPNGRLLFSHCWREGKTRVWNLADGEELLSFEGYPSKFAGAGSRLGYRQIDEMGIWEVDAGDALIYPNAQANGVPPIAFCDFSLDGEWLAAAGDEGAFVWNTRSWKLSAQIATKRATAILFDRSKSGIYLGHKAGLDWHAWTIQDGDPEIGPAVPLDLPEGIHPQYLAQSISGEAIVMDLMKQPTMTPIGDVLLLQPDHGQRILEGMPQLVNVDISPDGRSAIAGNWQGNNALFWNLGGENEPTALPIDGSVVVCFSPDGESFATAGISELTVWDRDTLTERFSVASSGVSRCITYSPDSQLIASASSESASSESTLDLIDAKNESLLVSLATNRNPAYVQWLKFHPDGTQLAMCCGKDGIQVWDINLLRRRLDKLGLPLRRPADNR